MQKRQESRASKGRPHPGEGGGGLEPEDRETEDGLSDVSPLKQVSSDETPPTTSHHCSAQLPAAKPLVRWFTDGEGGTFVSLDFPKICMWEGAFYSR